MKTKFKKFIKNQIYKIVIHPKAKKGHKAFIRVLLIHTLFVFQILPNCKIKGKLNNTYPWEESVKLHIKTVINKKKQKNPRYPVLVSL